MAWKAGQAGGEGAANRGDGRQKMMEEALVGARGDSEAERKKPLGATKRGENWVGTSTFAKMESINDMNKRKSSRGRRE